MFTKILLTLSMTLLLPLTAYAQKEALLVGVSEYQNFNRLNGIELDINEMKKILESRGFHVKVLWNQEATLHNVIQALQSYAHLKSNDTFVFYESSHGTQVPDLNGDEENSDGLDEALVLYDASKDIRDERGLLIDDTLQRLLAHIPAKKLMISDACHSGSNYKSFNRHAQTKGISRSQNFHFLNKDLALEGIEKAQNLIVLSASRDNEKAVATSSGSLFTSAISDALRDNPNITFKELEAKTTKHIKDICDNSNGELKAHHPSFFSTNFHFLDKPINDFLNVNITINRNPYLVENYLDTLIRNQRVDNNIEIKSKNFFYNGERVTLNINTLGKRGFLYILTSKERDNSIDVLYPNPYHQNSKEFLGTNFIFPKPNEPFIFQAENKTRGEQRTVIYVILSESPIPKLEISRKFGLNHFQSILKNFDEQISLKNALKNILIREKGNQISVGKTVFHVGV